MNQCFHARAKFFNLLPLLTRKLKSSVIRNIAGGKSTFHSNRSFHTGTMDEISFVGTSARGLTKEIEIPVPWGKIGGKTFGDEKNFPVLCTHGWLDNCNTFDTLIPYLPKDKFFVLIDFPGHGASSPIHKGMCYSIHLYISVLQRVVKFYNWKYLSILGHSLGGNVGALYAGTYPEKVDKLIIIDVAGVFPVPAENSSGQLRSCIDGHLDLEDNPEKFSAFYNYDDAKKRLLTANKSLTESAADILLERGTKKLENGGFAFTRDPRHKLRHPVSMTPEVGLHFINKIEAELLHIIAKEGILRKNISEIHKQALELLFNNFNNAQSKQMVEVVGRHHVHLCNPENIADHVVQFLSKPRRSGLEKTKLSSPNM